MNTPSTLDRFESALLEELRAHVATRPSVDPTPAPPRRHRRRWAAGLAAAAAAATAFVVVSPGGPATSPAYAVDREADGEVVVTIHRLEDAPGLEAGLRGHGIDASVSFEEWPPGLKHEFSEGDHLFAFRVPALTPIEPPTPGEDLPLPDCGVADGAPATIARADEAWVLRIPAASPLQDRPVAITTGAGGALGVFYPADDGSPCQVVDATD